MVFLAWLVYVPLQILWLPFCVFGAGWIAYKQVWRSRVLGLSQTAVEVLNGRWTAHVFGLRPDHAAHRLAAVLPNDSVVALWLTLFPLMVARTIAGRAILYPLLPTDDARASMASLVFSRTARFDQLIAAHADNAAQLVILGAGLDTRAYGPLADRRLGIFELDKPATQRAKREAVARAGIEAAHVHYVEVDFTVPNWVSALVATPFDPTLKTIFLWEGVTPYLSEATVLETLRTLRRHAGPGSVVLLDIYAERFVRMGRKGMAAAILRATGEPIDFGLDLSTGPQDALAAFAATAGYQLGAAYPMGAAHTGGAFMAVAAFEMARGG